MMERRTLYHKAKGGELRVWSCWSEADEIKTEYGTLNGALQISSKVAIPKNVGRKNATSGEEQADLEAKALWQFKKDRKYSETIEGAQEPLVLPMLAKEIEERKVKFPCYIQPKLDGVRCLAFWSEGKIKLLSRAGKEWAVPVHINQQLEQLLPEDCMLDGELYLHGKSCQTITSYVKKWREVETPTVEYHVYDIPVSNGKDDLPFKDRFKYLQFLDGSGDYDNCRADWPNIKFLETSICNSMEEVKAFEKEMIEQVYEGAIVRNTDGLYLFGYRSNDLLKVKTFQDAEFEVVGCKEGVGKFVGCAIFTCKNNMPFIDDNGPRVDTFDCTLATTMEQKAKMFQEKEKYIGRKLTVKFFDRTDDNIPRFPVGKCFRVEEDLAK